MIVLSTSPSDSRIPAPRQMPSPWFIRFREDSLNASLVFVTAWAIALCGCGSRTELAAVRGKVTLDGQPLPDAFVVFAPTTHGTTSYGRTDAGRSYEMMFTDTEKGAWIGENLVRISTGDLGREGDPGLRLCARNDGLTIGDF
jgi:hypothetical protein